MNTGSNKVREGAMQTPRGTTFQAEGQAKLKKVTLTHYRVIMKCND